MDVTRSFHVAVGLVAVEMNERQGRDEHIRFSGLGNLALWVRSGRAGVSRFSNMNGCDGVYWGGDGGASGRTRGQV